MVRELFAVVACAAVTGLACKEHAAPPRDASSDGIGTDVSSPLSVTVSVTGCTSYDPDVPLCAGPPPLALSFAPVGSAALTQFIWTFGDGTPSTTERAPSHVFAHLGQYEVTVIGHTADMGDVRPPNPLKVRVDALATGAPCDVDAQCGDGLTCTCAPGSGCAPAFIRGVCSAPCDTVACATGAVCATVAVGPPADAGAPRPLCLASCDTNDQCATPGFVCRTMPDGSAAPAARWTKGCLPLGLAGDLGASCRNANDALSDSACATGSCADVGALGACSASCDDSYACPPEASCARLADGRQLCLRRCGSDPDCAGDPLLACAQTPTAAPGGPGVTVCAPRSCANDNACPTGRCGPDAFCVRK